MLSISNELKERFNNGEPQCCYVFFPNLNLLITGNDIKQGSFALDNRCTTGKWYNPGDAVSSECSFTLLNSDGRYDDINFSGQPFIVDFGIKGYSDDHADNYFSSANQLSEIIKDLTTVSLPIRVRYAGDPKGIAVSNYYGGNFFFENGTTATVQKLGLGESAYAFDYIENDRYPMGVFYNNKFEKSYGKKEIGISGLDVLSQTDVPFPISALSDNENPTLKDFFNALKNYSFFQSTGFVLQFENESEFVSILDSLNTTTSIIKLAISAVRQGDHRNKTR